MLAFEPLLKSGGVATLVIAVLSLLRTFGAPLTEEQQDAIVQVAAIVAPLVVALVARSKVTPANAEGDYSRPDGSDDDASRKGWD